MFQIQSRRFKPIGLSMSSSGMIRMERWQKKNEIVCSTLIWHYPSHHFIFVTYCVFLPSSQVRLRGSLGLISLCAHTTCCFSFFSPLLSSRPCAHPVVPVFFVPFNSYCLGKRGSSSSSSLPSSSLVLILLLNFCSSRGTCRGSVNTWNCLKELCCEL